MTLVDLTAQNSRHQKANYCQLVLKCSLFLVGLEKVLTSFNLLERRRGQQLKYLFGSIYYPNLLATVIISYCYTHFYWITNLSVALINFLTNLNCFDQANANTNYLVGSFHYFTAIIHDHLSYSSGCKLQLVFTEPN